ncbi:MAG: VWA domain-containing protein, partial [Candidatus Melainabacteria bacterium]|nr:VWA domain-containing protein [Candidatus Melainabacteria bacterium]
LPMSPAANKAQLYFQYLDPVTRQAVPLGSTNGKIIQVTGAFGFVPFFSKFLKLLGPYPVVERSNGGLPQLDVVLCFDISASMDDFTLVSVVNRYNINKANPKLKQANGYTVLLKGPLYTAFKCTSPTGTALNATYPQELDAGGGAASFSAAGRGANTGALAPSASATSFTDVVVNIDGTNDFSKGITVNGCVFPPGNVGLLVEAARGNFESAAIATAAGVDYTTWGVTPKAGYYAAYQQSAQAQRHPISDAILAAINFYTIMNNDCDAHFSLVTFGSDPGTTSKQLCDPDYATLGNITDNPSTFVSNGSPSDPMVPLPPNPGIPLVPAAGPAYSNYSSVVSSVQTLIAYGGTNIAGALQYSIKQLQSTTSGGLGLARPGAKKAIVLFTDGLPTASSLGGDPTADARAQAVAANAAGIPIYCIGLCLVPSLQASQTAVLNDTNTNASTGGIAAISGSNAQYYQATDPTQLNQVFENVARSLVNLIR